MTDSKPREAGIYLCYGDEPMKFDGEAWWQFGLDVRLYGDDAPEDSEIGPRIYPPGEALAAEQGELIAALREMLTLAEYHPRDRLVDAAIHRAAAILAKHAPPSPEDK